MKEAVRIVQWLVAALFIVSGLVKANDPLGLSYKMQEFFELWSAGLHKQSTLRSAFQFLHDTSLGLSVFVITLEIAAGVALLLGWAKKWVLRLLLLLILFFTFLTGYAYLSGKFTNCGCFGDCLPITPLASFLKDLFLLALILFLLIGQRSIQTAFPQRRYLLPALLLASVVLSIGLQWYVLQGLPLVDCLPFKKGANIAANMKPPPGSKPDSVVMKFIYEKAGKRYEWGADELPSDFTTYKYIDRVDRVVRKGNADPPIKGFVLLGGSGEDSISAVLQMDKAALLFVQDFSDRQWLPQAARLATVAKAGGYYFCVVSASREEAARNFVAIGVRDVSFFNTDFTVVRTVARTNPTLLVLRKGTVVQKFGRSRLAAAEAALASPSFIP